MTINNLPISLQILITDANRILNDEKFIELLEKSRLNTSLLALSQKIDLILKRADTVALTLSEAAIEELIKTYNTYLILLNDLKHSTAAVLRNNDTVYQINISELNKRLDECWILIAPTYLENEIAKLDSFRIQGKQDADAIKELKATMQNQLNDFEERYKDLFVKREVLKQEDIFSKASSQLADNAVSWLIAIGILVITLFSFLFCFLFSTCYDFKCLCIDANSCDDSKVFAKEVFYYGLIKSSLIRLFILSTLVYLLKVAIKNYNNSKHNQTINTHKANSLAAAAIMIDRAFKEESKDKIYELAGREIFSQQKTGYLAKEQGIDINILEKLAGILKGSK